MESVESSSAKPQAPVVTKETPISVIECEKAFNALNLKEKLYCYYFTRASWQGAQICYFQRSFQSPGLLYLFTLIFRAQSPSSLRRRLESSGNFTSDQVSDIFYYVGSVYSNCGNYLSFGDKQQIPNVSSQMFLKFIRETTAFQKNQMQIEYVLQNIMPFIFGHEEPFASIEFIDKKGLSSYYSPSITRETADQITRFLNQLNISPINTRVTQLGENTYEVSVASISKKSIPKEAFEGTFISVRYGEFAPFLNQAYLNLAQCLAYCENQTQRKMILAYMDHFQTGDIELHKRSQSEWIKDKDPIIETNLGFIETLLDPLRIRAEFEGFVAIVNKEESKKLSNLVNSAEQFIEYLPWPQDYEKEQFSKPDFTSLEVLTFATSGIPVGICLPNYDDIREHQGYQNVNLGNAYGKPGKSDKQYSFPEDAELSVQYSQEALFIIVALHELLGHGSGRHLIEDQDGKLNFDQDKLEHPFQQDKKITTFYQGNESYHSKFGEVSTGYEECRADTVALYLMCYDDVLDILLPQFSKEERSDIVYVSWYDSVLGGLLGLQHYIPEHQKWGQAHVLANYAITMVLIEAGLVDFIFPTEETLTVRFHREKILTVGKQSIGHFLSKLQIYQSIGDSENGIRFFEQYSHVDEMMLKIRKIIISNQKPRRIEMQHDVVLRGVDDNCEYIKFKQDIQGLIESYVHHHSTYDMDFLLDEWKQTLNLYKYQI